MRSSTCVDLFAIPSKLFHTKERLCLVEKHPSSHHAYLIASDTTLLLMDDRFPGCPVSIALLLVEPMNEAVIHKVTD